MALLEKLEISGIRLYKEDEQPQIINFEPITLITGDNGAGKSTIIEALKFATLGQCSKELIADPFIWGKEKTTSKVTLSFKGIDQNEYQINLNPNINKSKNNKGSFQTGLCKVTIKKTDNREESFTVNSSEIENKVPPLLRASPSIIDNVIFCDQKQSLWPIDDKPKELKKKFDQIFGLDKYKDKIDALKTTITALKQKYNDNKVELATQKEKQNSFYSHKAKKEKIVKEISKFNDQIDETNVPFKSLKNSLEEYNKLIPVIKEHDDKINEIKGQLKSEKQNMDFIKSKIENLLPEDQYKVLLKNTSDEIASNLETIKSHKELFSENGKKQKKLSKEKKEIKEKIDHLKEMQLAHDSLLHYSKEFEHKYQSNDYDTILSEKEEFFKKAQKKLDDFKKQTNDTLNQKNEEITNLKELYAIEKANIENLNKELKKNNEELNEIGLIDDNLKNAESLSREALKNYNYFLETERNPEAISKEITDDKKELKVIKKQLESLEKEKIESLKIEKVEKQIKKSQLVIDNQLEIIKKEMDDQSINPEQAKEIVENKIQELKKEIKSLRKKQQKIVKEHGSLNNQLEKEQSLHQLDEQEFEQAEMRIIKVIKNIDDYYIDCQSNEVYLTFENQQLEVFKNNLIAYNKLKKEADNCHSCPLCKRKFLSDDEFKKFIETDFDNNIKDFIEIKLPQQIKDCESKIREYENKLEKLKSINDDVKTYQNHQMSSEKRINNIIKLQDKVADLTSQLNNINLEIAIKEDMLEQIEKLNKNVIMLDQALQKVKSSTAKREELNLSSLPIGKIREKEEELINESSILQSNIEKLFSDISNYNIKKSELEIQLKEAEQNFTSLDNQFSRKAILDSSNESIQREITEIDNKSKDLIKKINDLKQKNKDLTDSSKQKIDDLEKKRDDAKNEYHECFSIFNNIKKSKVTSQSSDLEDITYQLKDFGSKLKEKESELVEINNNLTKLFSEIEKLTDKNESLEKAKKDYDLQEEYYKKKNSYDLLKRNLEKIEKERLLILGNQKDVDIKNLNDQYQKMQKEIIALEANKENAIKQSNEEEAEMKKLEESIILFKKAVFRSILIEMSISDIERYIRELDAAILKYHDEKMEDINDTIHNLWQNIYYGNDIDSIAIRCEGEKSGRSQYNYRVVILRNGYEMDMNKCCSAGQRALASIIIRLALAQTFAMSCPIIALDEPTTNLDEYNYMNLASQLLNLTKYQDESSNANRKPFQIIIITHNLKFVRNLVENGALNSFYQITKQKEGCRSYSKIKRCTELNIAMK